MRYSKVFPEEVAEYIKANCKGKTHKEMQALIIKEFGIERSLNQIKYFYSHNHISSGFTGRFEKGCIPHNKGRKMTADEYEKSKHNFYQKGHKPATTLPVGTERLSTCGYMMVKIADPAVWELKHRLLWEKHYGKIPDNCVICFKDNDKTNITLDNLVMLTKSEHSYINMQGIRFHDAELMDAAVNIARLMTITKRRSNESK